MAEEGASTRQRKLRNVCTASDYDELRKAYRFVPEPPSEGSSNWQERMARRYESHLYREFVLADLTRHQMGQIGLRWRTKDEVCSGKGFDTCGNKHCPSYRSPDGSGFRDIEAARRASLSRASEESMRRYLGLQEQKDKVSNQASRATHRDCVKDACREEEEEEEMNALSQLPYGSGLADYEVPFTYVEQGVSKTELVKLRLCLRCAPLLFSGRGGSLGAKRARSDLMMKKLPVSTTKQEKNEDDDDEDASSVSSQRSCSSSTDEDSRRKRRASKKSRKRKNDKRRHRSDRGRDESGERRRKRKRRGEGRRNEKKEVRPLQAPYLMIFLLRAERQKKDCWQASMSNRS